GLLALLGAAMFAVVFMPFVGKQAGQLIIKSSFFTISVFRGNNLTSVYFGKPAVLLAGTGPVVLGLLLITASILFLFKRQRLIGWSVIIAGSLAVIIAAVDLITIYSRLGPDISRGFIGTNPGYGLWILLAVAVAATAVGILIIFKYRSHTAAQDRQ
ncbi:MAG: hypothetical protein MUO75_08210, partial [Actinobacteria bacterium]|nr:hypothetical protein [Actinomycetota bacterium]